MLSPLKIVLMTMTISKAIVFYFNPAGKEIISNCTVNTFFVHVWPLDY